MWLTHGSEDIDAIAETTAQAVSASQRCADPAVLSSALDGQSVSLLVSLRAREAAKVIEERLRLTEQFATEQFATQQFAGQNARLVLERTDALYMACDVSFLMGDFEGTLNRGLELDRLARCRGIFYGGLTHLAPANFFLGNFNDCLEQASGVYWKVTQRRDVGASLLERAFSCAGAVCGYRGDDQSAARWYARAGQLKHHASCPWKCDFSLLMKADVHLHHGRREEAALLLADPPPRRVGEWRGWYAALRAEALGGQAIEEAEEFLEGGAYSRAVLARARGDLKQAHSIFRECGAVYQVARTGLQMSGRIREEALATYRRLGLSEGLFAGSDEVDAAVTGTAT
jgi:hypothetical protein